MFFFSSWNGELGYRCEPFSQRSVRWRMVRMRNKAVLWLKFSTMGRLIVPAKRVIFFRCSWNANFIVREMWNGYFIFRDAWPRPHLYHPFIKEVTHLLWNGHNSEKKTSDFPPNKSRIYDLPITWTELWENRGNSRNHYNQSIDLPINA